MFLEGSHGISPHGTSNIICKKTFKQRIRAQLHAIPEGLCIFTLCKYQIRARCHGVKWHGAWFYAIIIVWNLAHIYNKFHGTSALYIWYFQKWQKPNGMAGSHAIGDFSLLWARCSASRPQKQKNLNGKMGVFRCCGRDAEHLSHNGEKNTIARKIEQIWYLFIISNYILKKF